MHAGLSAPPTVTSEFLKVNSGAGGFSQHTTSSASDAVLRCGVEHRYRHRFIRSCIMHHVLSTDPRQLSSVISSFLYSSPKKRSFLSEFMSTIRQGHIHPAHTQLKRIHRGTHPSQMKSTPTHTLWAQYCSVLSHKLVHQVKSNLRHSAHSVCLRQENDKNQGSEDTGSGYPHAIGAEWVPAPS
jgi:hypothetical protein